MKGKKKATKGQVQDALGGLAMPKAADVFPWTGVQAMGPATGAMRSVGSTLPANQVPSSVPGSTASLQGGESPFVIPAEQTIDLTKKARKAVEKELGQRLKMLSVLKQRAAVLQKRQPNNPWALSALGVAAVNERRAQNVATGPGGSVVKGLIAIDPTEVAGALADVSRALGISDSAARWEPQQLDALQQLQGIMSGQPESLRGSQNSAAAGVGGPAAVLGQVLKSGLGEEIAQAEAAVRKAEQAGDAVGLSRAGEQLTLLRLKAHHRAMGMN